MFVMEINWLALVVAVVINIILGTAWYSNNGFGKVWRELVSKGNSKWKEIEPAKMFFYTLITSLLIAYVLSIVIKSVGASKAQEGMIVGLIMWIGFVLSVGLGDYIMSNRPSKLFLINIGFYLISLVLMGAVIASWV